MGGMRMDFSQAGEARKYSDDGIADALERVSAPANPLWEGLDGDDAANGRLKAERGEGFQIIEKAGANLELSRVCIDLAKTQYKDVHMRKTLCSKFVPGDADAQDGALAHSHALFSAQVKELSRVSQAAQAAACLYIAARREHQSRSMKEILGGCKEWRVGNKQLNEAKSTICRVLGVELHSLTAGDTIENWAAGLKLSEAVARAAAEIADNCSRTTVQRCIVEVVDCARMQELLKLGYSLTQQVAPPSTAAGSAAQIM